LRWVEECGGGVCGVVSAWKSVESADCEDLEGSECLGMNGVGRFQKLQPDRGSPRPGCAAVWAISARWGGWGDMRQMRSS